MNLNGDFFLNRKMIIAIDSMDRNSIFDPKLGLRIIAVLVAIKQKINNIEIGLVLDFIKVAIVIISPIPKNVPAAFSKKNDP